LSFSKESQQHCPPPPGWGPIAAMAVRCFSVACRYLLAASALLVPVSVVTATSCADLNCGVKCDPSGGGTISCGMLAVAECSTYSFCAVRTGCACAGLSSANPNPKNCNSAACYLATDTTECARTTGCEWGDHCRDITDCHAMDLDENACRKNMRCAYHKDCG